MAKLISNSSEGGMQSEPLQSRLVKLSNSPNRTVLKVIIHSVKFQSSISYIQILFVVYAMCGCQDKSFEKIGIKQEIFGVDFTYDGL